MTTTSDSVGRGTPDHGAPTTGERAAAGGWHPGSWQDYPAAQQPPWPDAAAHAEALAELATLPPLVFAGEARRLTRALGDVAAGNAFLLQAGDCAESFDDFSADGIRDKLKVILQMAVVLTYGSGVPVVKLGRIAGQFAKPRSSPTERVDEVELPVFRGHIINDDVQIAAARVPDPRRMLRAYHQSASTLNLLRAFTKGGFADLSQVHSWKLEFLATSAEGRRFEAIAEEIDRAPAVHACLRRGPVRRLPDPPGRPLHEPRGPAARVRGGAHAARTRLRATGTTARPTSSGSGSAPVRSTGRTSSSPRGSGTRSRSSSVRARPPTRCSRSASASTPTACPEG